MAAEDESHLSYKRACYLLTGTTPIVLACVRYACECDFGAGRGESIVYTTRARVCECVILKCVRDGPRVSEREREEYCKHPRDPRDAVSVKRD